MMHCNPQTLSCADCPAKTECKKSESERRAIENRKVANLMKEWGFSDLDTLLFMTQGQPLRGTA